MLLGNLGGREAAVGGRGARSAPPTLGLGYSPVSYARGWPALSVHCVVKKLHSVLLP